MRQSIAKLISLKQKVVREPASFSTFSSSAVARGADRWRPIERQTKNSSTPSLRRSAIRSFWSGAREGFGFPVSFFLRF